MLLNRPWSILKSASSSSSSASTASWPCRNWRSSRPASTAQDDDRPQREGRRPSRLRSARIRAGSCRRSRSASPSSASSRAPSPAPRSASAPGSCLDRLAGRRSRSASASSSPSSPMARSSSANSCPKQIALRNPEGDRLRRRAPDDEGVEDRAPLVVLLDASTRRSPALGQRGAIRGERHRRGDQDHRRRGRASRRDRDGRAPHDRRRHAPRRPRGARRDDAAHGRRLDRP